MRIAVLFDNLGPYHIARLEELSRVCKLLVIEAYDASHEYAWDPACSVGFERITLQKNAGDRSGTLICALREALIAAQPDAVFIPGWSSRFALGALAWCLSLGIPAILMSDTQRDDFKRRFLLECVKRWIVRSYSGALVAGSSHVKYAAELGMPLQFIRTGYDVVDNKHFLVGARVARASRMASARRHQLPDRYFITVARLIEKKNLVSLVRAYHEYVKLNNEGAWGLVIVGDGPLRKALELEVEERGLKGLVHFMGHRSYAEIPELYGLASAMVLPSKIEQWGLVVNEAMAAGLPVLVSTCCGCVPDLVVEGKTGFTFNPDDERSLTALLELLTSMRLEARMNLGVAAQDRVADFSVERFAGNARELASVVKGRGKQSYLRALIVRWLSMTRLRG